MAPLPPSLPSPERVLLLFPMSSRERRWKSSGVPPSALFLAGGLQQHGIEPDFSLLDVERGILEPERDLSLYDWIAITIYDEFFLQIKSFAARLRRAHPGIKISAGGPMVTLAAHAVAECLEEANLLVRGEADLLFGQILSSLPHPERLSRLRGFLLRDKGFTFLADFHYSEVVDPSQAFISVDVTPPGWERRGLEINTSRGCPRRCLFCSHVHGHSHRTVSPERYRDWLHQFMELLKRRGCSDPTCFTVNINDDDILLDLEHAEEIFRQTVKAGFKIWGVQTSISSLLGIRGRRALEITADERLYARKPLLWIGSDTFSSKRARRLRKAGVKEESILQLLANLEKAGITSYHYWILSDAESDWDDFIEEFLFVWKLKRTFPHFHILPNSPFLIPFPYTPSYSRATSLFPERLVVKRWLESSPPYPLVEHEKPASEYLYWLLHPQRCLIPGVAPGSFLSRLWEENFSEAAKVLLSALSAEISSLPAGQRRTSLAKIRDRFLQEAALL